MSLNVGKVWKVDGDHEVLVSSNEIQTNDIVHVQMGKYDSF